MYDTFNLAISSKITPYIVFGMIYNFGEIFGNMFILHIYHHYCSLLHCCLMESAMLKRVTCAEKNIYF